MLFLIIYYHNIEINILMQMSFAKIWKHLQGTVKNRMTVSDITFDFYLAT